MSSPFEPTITPEMMSRYVSRRRDDLMKLQAALAAGDFATLKGIAHQIKGNAATFSFIDLEKAAIDLENAALAGDADASSSAVRLMQQWLNSQS